MSGDLFFKDGNIMRNILITGGTVFVSKYMAEYFANKNENVFVFNRNRHPGVAGTILIEGDKTVSFEALKDYRFDLVIAVNIYNKKEMKNLLDGLKYVKDFIFISSSAVYPETTKIPFKESDKTGFNSIWKQYGSDKLDAEKYLTERLPKAYILRPPYLYGKYQNLYREGFVFDCALRQLPFYIPKQGKLKLQFFNVYDLCLFIDTVIAEKPGQHIFNVGNSEPIDINEYAELCYKVVGSRLNKVYVNEKHNQRNYFPFYDYEYYLDISQQNLYFKETVSMYDGLKESFEWYRNNQDKVIKRDYFSYIKNHLT